MCVKKEKNLCKKEKKTYADRTSVVLRIIPKIVSNGVFWAVQGHFW